MVATSHVTHKELELEKDREERAAMMVGPDPHARKVQGDSGSDDIVPREVWVDEEIKASVYIMIGVALGIMIIMSSDSIFRQSWNTCLCWFAGVSCRRPFPFLRNIIGPSLLSRA